MNIPERILQYLEHKGISKLAFYKAIGVTNGYLDKKQTIGAEKIAVITEIYSDLNLSWLITGKGEMLNPEGEYTGDERTLKPNEIISKLVLQNETLIAIIDRHSTIIEKLSSHL